MNFKSIIDKLNYSHYFNIKRFEKAKQMFLNFNKQLADIHLGLVKDYRNFFLQMSLGILAIVGGILYSIDKIGIEKYLLVKLVLFGFLGFILFSFLYLSIIYWIDFYYIKQIKQENSNRIGLLSLAIAKILQFKFGKEDADKLNKELEKPFYQIPKIFNWLLPLFSIIASLSFVFAIICLFILISNL